MLLKLKCAIRCSIVVILVILFQSPLNISYLYGQESNDIKIGTQIWTSKNLDVSTFRNGEAIPEAKNAEEWESANNNQTAAFCYYDFDSNNGKAYGKLYNWYAVNDPRGLAPKGYHIPSDAEWTTLIDFLGGEDKAGKQMKSKTGWSDNDKRKDANGDNSSGFNGLQSGYCFDDGYFYKIPQDGQWWSSSESTIDESWSRGLYWYNNYFDRISNYKSYGLSVRCHKD